MTTARNRRKTTAIVTALLLAGAFLTGGAVALDQHVDAFDVPVFVVAGESDEGGACIDYQQDPPAVGISPSECVSLIPPLP